MNDIISAKKLKNLAVVAHVDHGKTTLIDGILKQTQTHKKGQESAERIMDSGEIEKERGITINAKNCSITWRDTRINLLDTPGHADFGGEVERSLVMVDGVLLLVDAQEGPLPQTRFVLEKALKRGLKVLVVINKVDRPDARIDEVKVEVEDLLLELASLVEADDFDLDIPFFYASGKNGWATSKLSDRKDNLHELLDFMIGDYFPDSPVDSEGPLKLLVANLSYSSYLGPLLVGRITQGVVSKNQEVVCLGANNKKTPFKVSSISIFDKLQTSQVMQASSGEIILLSGLSDGAIGDTISDANELTPLPRIEVEPPTVEVAISVNTSPGSGREGEYMTGRMIADFLKESCLAKVALQYSSTEDPKVYHLKGRGELQLSIIFEELRRKGHEFMLSRPRVLEKKDEETQERLEPYERVVVDVPSDMTGRISEVMSERKGIMQNMRPLSDTRMRMVFEVPSRGLIGYRSQFLTDTRGQGIMSSEFIGYRKYAGDFLNRMHGAIISDRSGKITPYALFNLLNLGDFFVIPGQDCYEGQVIGEHKKQNDINVNPAREKHLSSVRTAGKDTNVILPPPKPLDIEKALDWIDDDEWVEVTPKSLRIRKKALEQNKRSVIRN